MRTYLELDRLFSTQSHPDGHLTHFESCSQFIRPNENPILITKIQIFYDGIGEGSGRYKMTENKNGASQLQRALAKLNQISIGRHLLENRELLLSRTARQNPAFSFHLFQEQLLSPYLQQSSPETRELKLVEQSYIRTAMPDLNLEKASFLPIPVLDQGKWEAMIYLVYDRNLLDLYTNSKLDQIGVYVRRSFYPNF